MPNPLNRTSAPQIIRFFDVCFKEGVVDACNLGDDITAKEFLNLRLEDWKFGTLERQDETDWKSYVFTLYWLARRNHLSKLAENYIFKIRRKNYMWCLLPYCMRFYLMGIQEWLSYPNPVSIESFKAANRAHWDPKSAVKKFTTMDFISHMHDIAYAFKSIPEEDREVSDFSMDSFCQAIFDLTRRYVWKKDEDL